MHLTAAQRQILETLWYDGPISRSDLSNRLNMTPNAIGNIAAQLRLLGFVSEMPAEVVSRGRPKIPLRIDGRGPIIVGLSVGTRRVEACRVNLRGDLLSEPVVRHFAAGKSPLVAAARLLTADIRHRGALIALSVPGLVDQATGKILLSSAFPDARAHTVMPVIQAAGGIPLIVGNDLHAAAANWTLSHRNPAIDDVLLANIADGQIGAAMLINGKPNRGCILGANELGHTRLPIAAPPCYCGGKGCIERIFSSQYLADGRGESTHGLLARRLEANARTDRRLQCAMSSLALVLSNAVNFMRPARLVIATPFADCQPFIKQIAKDVRQRLLTHIASRMQIQIWNQQITGSAHMAAWLGIAGIVLPGWNAYEAQLADTDRTA